MIVSVETLERVASETSFRPDAIERVMRLLDVLQRVAQDEFLGPRFALKGGTALNLFFLDIDRLSVDSDLNYIGASDRAQMLQDKEVAQRRIADIAKRQRYDLVTTPILEHAGGKWVFRYTSAYGRKGTLEVDTNYLYRTPFFGTKTLSSASIGGVAADGVKVVNLNEVVAGKLVAMVTRSASRDLFDMRRLLKHPDVDWSLVKSAAIAIGAASRDYDWRRASIADYRIDPGEVRSKLIGLVRRGEIAEGRERTWCEQVIEQCRARLVDVLTLNAAERAFLDALYEEGRIDTTLLSGSQDFKDRVAKFPALLWKAQNRRAHIAGVDPGPRIR